MSGAYDVRVYNKDDVLLSEPTIAVGSAIYSVRNAFCIQHHKAVVKMIDLNTQQELKSESPYQCILRKR